nr:hypothetical protein [Desulfobacterales bacterium]
MQTRTICVALLTMVLAVLPACRKEAPPPKEVIRAIKTIKADERARGQ